MQSKESHVPIIDLHADIPWDITDKRTSKSFDQNKSVLNDFHLEKLRRGGIAGFNAVIWVESKYKPNSALARGLKIVDCIYEDLKRTENFAIVTRRSEFENLTQEGRKIATLLGVEEGELIESDISLLRIFHRLGVRSFGFVWNERNQLADGYGEIRMRNGGSGLSELGFKVVQEYSRLGIIVDGAHITPNGLSDMPECSKAPIIVSHGSTTVHNGTLRPLSDEHLKIIAKNSGVAGVFAINLVHSMPTLESYLDHVEYAIKVAGIEHVGLGFDFCDYNPNDDLNSTRFSSIERLENHTKSQSVIKGLRGFSEDQIRKVASENFLRVLEEVTK